MKISIVVPSRDNLKYLKWSYDSIRKHQGDHEVFICAADDNSSDGTWDWMKRTMESDDHFSAIRNDSGERLGHTILYDRIVQQLVDTDIAMIWHADMYLAPNALDEVERHMAKGHIVSLTRVEPPLHPKGKEKIIKNFGTEPENFKEDEFITWVESYLERDHDNTDGVFAPWAFYVEDFLEVHGHDPLYKPQSKEDSDIFNKFELMGHTFVQTWSGVVYHLTSRGSRYNPKLTDVGQNSSEWDAQNLKSHRNFIRKWGTQVMHDDKLHPVAYPKYKIYLLVRDVVDYQGSLSTLIWQFEPNFHRIIFRDDLDMIEHAPTIEDTIEAYVMEEEQNTLYDLDSKFEVVDSGEYDRALKDDSLDVVVDVSMETLNDTDRRYLYNMPVILHENDISSGAFGLGNLQIIVNDLQGYQRENLKEENNIEIKRLF